MQADERGDSPSDRDARGIVLAQQFRAVVFPLARRGYAVAEVDSWLEAAAASITPHTGASVEPPDEPSFRVTLRGYDRRAVDAFVDDVQTAFEEVWGFDFGSDVP